MDEESLRRMEEEYADTIGEGEAADGLIYAMVGAAGGIERIDFDPRVMRLDSKTLAEQVTKAVRLAQEDAAHAVRELSEPLMGHVDQPESADDFWTRLRDIREDTEKTLRRYEDDLLRRIRDIP